MPWTDVRDNAAWASAVLTDRQWRAVMPKLHPVFLILCICLWSVRVDILHTISLGVAQEVVGCVLYLLVYHMLPGTPAENKNAVWGHIREYYRISGAKTQIRKLTFSMFLPKVGAPHAHFPSATTKGKETQHLAEACLWIWDQYQDQTNDMHKRVRCVLQCLETVYRHADSPSVDGQLRADAKLDIQRAV